MLHHFCRVRSEYHILSSHGIHCSPSANFSSKLAAPDFACVGCQVTTLMSAAKPITNTVGIALVVFSIYGILGMQFLLGRMGSCSDPIVWRKEECTGVDAGGVPLIWKTHPVNFDNLYRAIVAMFILATQDDWQGHMVTTQSYPPALCRISIPFLLLL
jgi:hypothetical protein